MRISDYEKGLRALGPFRITTQLRDVIVQRAKEENRTQSNYLINLIITDARAHGYDVDPDTVMASRRPAMNGAQQP